jgi:hypothetical protein
MSVIDGMLVGIIIGIGITLISIWIYEQIF